MLRLVNAAVTTCLSFSLAVGGPAELLARQNPAPSGVRVQGSGTSVTISWSPLDLPGISYRVLRAPDARTAGTDLTAPISTLSFVDATTAPATTYYYQVVAVYRRENVASVPVAFTTAPSTTTTLRTITGVQPIAVAPSPLISPTSTGTLSNTSRLAIAPAAPANLYAAPAGFKVVSLTWAPVSGVASYRVFGPALPAAGAVVSSQPLRVTDVPSGDQTFTISSEYAGASNGPGLPRSTVGVAPFDGPIASAKLDQGNPTVSFDFNVTATDQLAFHLYRDDGKGGTQSELTGVTWNRSTGSSPSIAHITGRATQRDLVPGLEYKYQIGVVLAGGDLYPSMLMPVRSPVLPSPTALYGAPADFKAVNLTWTVVPKVPTYRIWGPTLPAAGVMVSAQPYRVMNLPSGTQTFSISSEYPGAVNGPTLPQTTVGVAPFSGVMPSLFVDRTSTMVDINFIVTASETLTFQLYRDDGRGGEQKEITSSVNWTRQAGSVPGTASISGRTFPADLVAGLEYKYQLVVGIGNGQLVPTNSISVRMPQYLVRATVPLANDRVVVEWNQFGAAPYRVKKGVQTGTASSGLALPMDFVRDAAGNPLTFTGVKFEDFVVQHGVTYFYEVCANTIAPYTPGMSCPGVAVAIP